MAIVVIQGPQLNQNQAEEIAQKLGGELEAYTHYHRVHTSGDIEPVQLQQLRSEFNFDINQLPQGFEPENVKLLITDMDSTLINIECVDEIADFIDVKPQVSEITESAMRGEIDFATSLRKRVGLLEGLDESALAHVYDERLNLNPGAEEMLAGLKSKNIKAALVSGGFTFFTSKLHQRLSLDYSLANTLDIVDGKLTGTVKGDIIGAEAKAKFLLQLCEELNITPKQTIAVGDGANDLLMMNEAGLSVAYHAKPKVQEQANTALNYCGLNGILGLLNI